MNIEKLEKLVDIIEKHPEAYINIDNDCWYIWSQKPEYENGELCNGAFEVAHSDDFQYDTRWYGASWCYGAGIAEALIAVLNRRGFNLFAEAV